ncbi:MAG: chorismate mutase [Alphaproteobacteria bacterium]|nr:chorismate mutase [Alphaproteobacteria bacterium]MCD8566403.1 chorismate mutase [Alphaproteobacteria bacterium]
MEELAGYRQQIDALDDQIVDLLARRFEIVRAVGQLKARIKIPVVQSARVDEVKDRVGDMAAAKNLDRDFVRHLYQIMIDHAHDLEDDFSEGDAA